MGKEDVEMYKVRALSVASGVFSGAFIIVGIVFTYAFWEMTQHIIYTGLLAVIFGCLASLAVGLAFGAEYGILQYERATEKQVYQKRRR